MRAERGRFVILPVFCMLAFGDTALKSWFLLPPAAREKRCDDEMFVLFFPASEDQETSKNF